MTPLAMVAVLGAAVFAAGNAEAAPLALGEKAPLGDQTLKNVDGRTLTLGSAAGPKGTLVIFTCNHCPYVKAWDSRIAALGNDFASRGIGVIAVNSNDPSQHEEDGFEGMVKRAGELGLRFPYVVDAGSKLARAFGANKTPEVFLFDAKGKLAYHGAVDDNYAEPEKVSQRFLRDALEAVLAGKPVPVAETKALGCSIKLQS